MANPPTYFVFTVNPKLNIRIFIMRTRRPPERVDAVVGTTKLEQVFYRRHHG